jgi:uncharacterized membrane protein (DUF441 family)
VMRLTAVLLTVKILKLSHYFTLHFKSGLAAGLILDCPVTAL